MDIKNKLLAASLSSLILVGCGGSGSDPSYGVAYEGNTSSADITESNQEALTHTALQVTFSVDGSETIEDLPIGVESSSQSPVSKEQLEVIRSGSKNIKSLLSNLPAGVQETISGNCGGSASVSGSEESFTVTYNNFCDSSYSEGYTVDGSVKISYSETDTSYKEVMTYNNFSMSQGAESFTMSGRITYIEYIDSDYFAMDLSLSAEGETLDISFSETCTYNPYECTESMIFKGNDGVAYRVDDLQVVDNGSSININSTIYDPVYGSLEMDADNITYCLDDQNQPQLASGIIYLSDGSDLLMISITGCGQYQPTLNPIR